MQECKRTQLYDVHVAAGASMVDFGGWEMPIQYPTGIVAEHLYTRHVCSLFDVSHMGRLLIQGPERVAFLQHVLTSNVMALDLNKAQYCIIPNENGGAVDDAYLYKFIRTRTWPIWGRWSRISTAPSRTSPRTMPPSPSKGQRARNCCWPCPAARPLPSP